MRVPFYAPKFPTQKETSIKTDIIHAPTGIEPSLVEMAEDEGQSAALSEAEKWRDVLLDMLTVASPEEMMHIRALQVSVDGEIFALLTRT